jgi:hypothetical protein
MTGTDKVVATAFIAIAIASGFSAVSAINKMRDENVEAIKAGLVQDVKDGRTIWVKPNDRQSQSLPNVRP